MENTQIEILSSQVIDKTAAAEMAQLIISAIENGDVDALNLKIKIKAIENVIETIKPILDKEARSIAEREGAKSFSRLGSTVKLQETGVKYDYSNCQDPKHLKLTESFEAAKAAKEKRETYLKALDKSETIVDEDSGEIVTIYPPIKRSTSSVVITL